MKRIIRIICLLIFMILILNITASYGANTYPTIDLNAERFTVTESTTPTEMLDALKAGKTLTGISANIKDDNDFLLCRERHWAIYGSAIYDSAGSPTTFPGTDENGYAKAYILAAGRDEDGNDEYYMKNDEFYGDVTMADERQYAWYFILGQKDYGTPNDLYNIAMDYQTYKKTEEKDVKVTVDANAETQVIGDNAVYGPIKVEYSYKASSSGDKSDEWGGFSYAFFDGNNSNISSKVKLCTLENGTYIPITSAEITSNDDSNGYYQVKQTTYNNVNLYVVTNDKAIGSVTLKMRENKVDYTATIYPIKGEQYLGSGIVLCSSCRFSISNSTTSMQEAVRTGKVLELNGSYYNYTERTTETVYWRSGATPTHVYRVGGTDYDATNATARPDYPTYVDAKYCGYCNNYHNGGHLTTGYEDKRPYYKCVYSSCTGKYDNEQSCLDHFKSTHLTSARKYTIGVYQFKPIGCGRDMGEKCSDCGTSITPGYYNSQGLHIIQTTKEEKSNEIKLDIEIEFSINVSVEKKWEDENNKYGNRPQIITVELLANGASTGKTLELNENNNWKGEFKELDVIDSSGNKINYSIKEISTPTGYIKHQPTGNSQNNFVITNTLERTEVSVEKKWEDNNNKKGIRPESITIVLYRNGTKVDEVTLSGEGNSWKYTFTNLPKYVNNELAIYTIEEIGIPDGYVSEKTGDETNGFIVTNSFYEGYIEITGKVWVDGEAGKGNDINGVFGEEDSPLKGIKVTLKDEKGNQFDPTSVAYTDANGNYTIKVNYDNSQKVYKLYEDSETVEDKLKTAYVEFEYDGLKYTTVKTSNTGSNTSKAIEDEDARTKFDKTYSTVTSSSAITTHQFKDKDITANTKEVISFGEYIESEQNMQMIERDEIIKYCNGNGTYTFTNKSGAWNKVQVENHTCSKCNNKGHSMETFSVDVRIIKNVNLGLFEREQPDVAIFSDLTKVQVTMNGEQYTYLYGVRSDKYKESELQVKFQNKDTYTYKRPVNPADIAYIQEPANSNAMSVLVTYEVKVANFSTTLPITVHNIKNTYDLEYTLNNEGWIVKEGTQFNEAIGGNLNITVEPQKESSAIELTYTVSLDAIKGLLNEEATLNNAVEIETYSTKYGAETLYAEQRTGERTGNPYGGYDYNSQPGNAGIFINNEGRLEAAKPEDDTDIAPSFVLCKNDTPKTLSGTIWEDKDITENAERLGNGKHDIKEKNVENVKVELYNLDGTPAKLYNKETKLLDRDAIVYTNENGEYSLDGVITGEYFIKYTYGNDTTNLGHEATTMDRGATTVNARNYKSTIITDPIIKNVLSKDYVEFTEEEKIWHITHEDGYSVAVDNMKERLEIKDLQYDNFDKPLNMSAYTKPFKTLLEFDTDRESQVTDAESGELEGVSYNLNKMDFGIIERPREDLFVQKTITYINLELANGQAITEGNPNTDTLNYAKVMGFENITSGEEARKALDKQLLIELDSELIQGASLKIDYQVKVTNNNEIDYDYGILEDYTDIGDNQYITKSPKANYYYYGNHAGLDEMKSTIEFVDYIDNELVYKPDTTKWVDAKAEELYNAGLINNQAKDLVKDQSYQIFRSASGASITLARGETFEQDMTASKILANKDKINYDNNVEIIKIDGKTARTIQESKGGIQVQKTYKPGNYVPNVENGTYEQDDDRVRVLVTSSTGVTNYIIPYIIAGLIGLILMVTAVIFIKKKVLIK